MLAYIHFLRIQAVTAVIANVYTHIKRCSNKHTYIQLQGNTSKEKQIQQSINTLTSLTDDTAHSRSSWFGPRCHQTLENLEAIRQFSQKSAMLAAKFQVTNKKFTYVFTLFDFQEWV